MATKKTAKKKVIDNVYWVLQARSGMFSWKAHKLYKTYAAATAARVLAESGNIMGHRGYKVDRVELAD